MAKIVEIEFPTHISDTIKRLLIIDLLISAGLLLESPAKPDDTHP